MDHPAPPGSRHEQAKRIACGLAGGGFSATEIYGLTRPLYPPDVGDHELQRLAAWAVNRFGRLGQREGAPAPAPFRDGGRPHRPAPVPALPPPAGAIRGFLRGFAVGEEALFDASPVTLPADWREDGPLLLRSLYLPGERVNLVTDFHREGDKARPKGRGKTLPREAWLAEIHAQGVPESPAGAWIRMNPLAGKGIADADVGACRFALLECDAVPYPLQMAFFARLPLPIAALVTSGGRSLHAWVRVNTPDGETYRKTVGEILERLAPYGVDRANRNPSRLARLPGVNRQIGASGDGRQRLLYLHPTANAFQPIFP